MRYFSALHNSLLRSGIFRNSCWFVLLFSLTSAPRLAGQNDAPATVDPQSIQALVRRIDQLEARVRELEAERQQDPGLSSRSATSTQQARVAAVSSSSPVLPASPALPQPNLAQSTASLPNLSQTGAAPTSPASGNIPANNQQEPAEPSEHAETERMDVSKTLLRIRGYGDVNLHGDNYRPAGQLGDVTSFTLGQLNLFVTSDISDRFRFLSEIVFEAGPDNIYGVTRGPENVFSVDVERYLLQYSYNDYFNLSAGRYHTAIGYYNTAYHHSTWLQTTTGRPQLFEFEDRGGILPIHNVGVEAYGLIPSGRLGLHYVAEIGNGRESRTPLQAEPVQNIVDDTNHKAVNFEIFARPTDIPGLQTGFSIYHDVLVPNGQPVNENILAAHAIYTKTNFEWLNEALVIRHTPQGLGHDFQTPGFYSQISQRFGLFRPYVRYDYINASPHEPIFPDVGLQAGPSAGVRYDASESVALKLQYDFTTLRNQPSTQGLTLQVGFTF
jgi:hypothetical protein